MYGTRAPSIKFTFQVHADTEHLGVLIGFYKKRIGGVMHYLVTGHTGFKGAWLTLMLKRQGHEVSGISLAPEPGSLFETANVSTYLEQDLRVDIRDQKALEAAMVSVDPDVVIHMAAQPLVRRSYIDPRETFETNVNGTLNVLEALAKLSKLKATLIITTDKVYRNVDQPEGYVETDPLGGDDPYSSSKAMADLLTQSWVKSFPSTPVAIARAGNVIGGGDVCKDRLVPDIVRAFATGKSLQIRYPQAVRPWQHVLDCLNGYLRIVDALLSGRGEGQWNIGPGRESFVAVGDLVKRAQTIWSGETQVEIDKTENYHEANLLALDATKAEKNLSWRNKLVYPTSLEWAIRWETSVLSGSDALSITMQQIDEFTEL